MLVSSKSYDSFAAPWKVNWADAPAVEVLRLWVVVFPAVLLVTWSVNELAAVLYRPVGWTSREEGSFADSGPPRRVLDRVQVDVQLAARLVLATIAPLEETSETVAFQIPPLVSA